MEYYNDYFNLKREKYAHLVDIPSNPTSNKHVLSDYSLLNVDEVGRIICELFKRYEHKDVIAKRNHEFELWENKFDRYTVELPTLVIGTPEDVKEGNKNNNNIIIDYSLFYDIKTYPTDNPVAWDTKCYGKPYEMSNYNELIGYQNDLSFDYKNYEFIKELIFSLAYYQRENNIKQMNTEDTWNVYKKIYK